MLRSSCASLMASFFGLHSVCSFVTSALQASAGVTLELAVGPGTGSAARTKRGEAMTKANRDECEERLHQITTISHVVVSSMFSAVWTAPFSSSSSSPLSPSLILTTMAKA